MSRIDGWRHRLSVLLRREEYHREQGEEIRFHLDLEEGQQRAQCGAGASDADVSAAARRRFGNVTYIEEEVRHMTGLTWIDALSRDLRLAARSLRRTPAFTLAVIVTLAIGIGANTAIFSFVRGVLLRPLPFRSDHELVKLWTDLPEFGKETASMPDYGDWKSQTSSFQSMGAYANTRFNLSMPNSEPERVAAAMADEDLFRTLGLAPAHGRAFTAGDMAFGSSHVAILSDALWRRYFNADQRVLNSTIYLNDQPYTVIGVAPAGAHALVPADLWVPLSFDPSRTFSRRGDFLHVIARLKPGMTTERAQRDASRLASALASEYPATNAGVGILVQPLRDVIIGDVRTPLITLAAAVGLLLLIGCANVANLMLARATARRREMAVRVALGAARGRLVRQLLTESVVLALVGGAVGMLVAVAGVRALKAAAPADMPRLDAVHVDLAVFAFAAVVAMLCGIAFGLMPALRATRGTLHVHLAHGSRGNASGGAERLRGGLVLAQTALALILAVGAGLLARSFQQLQQVNLGFDQRNVLTAQMLIPASRYATPEQQIAFFQQVRDRMRATPGVRDAALTTDLPMVPNYSYLAFDVRGRPAPAPGEKTPDAIVTVVDTSYFSTMRMALRSGRTFTGADRSGTLPTAVVSEQMARTYFGDASPLGERITFGDPTDTTATWYTIVGVVATTRLEGVGRDAYPQVFLPMQQSAQRSMFVVLRAERDAAALITPLRSAVKAIDPAQPIADVATMEERVAHSVAPARLNSMLIAVFSIIAVVLAGVGIYGVVSYTVAQRTREIGIRLALGANGSDVLRLITRCGMAPALAGVAVGLVAAVYLARLARGLLYGVTAWDPVSLAGAALLLAAIAAMACLVPGLRAARVQPVVALTEE
ncbi:MAG TPA: ABC transporter permease [Gemmatimonadaceae bacterium]|nr:ABC transporter permease [Gemmatimonadaceae bacterium]